MATKGANKAAEEKVFFDIKGMKVTNVRKLSDKAIAFSLLGKGLGLYNLRVVAGKNGDFVASPQTKGKDGNYYSVYAVYISDEDQKKIISAVLKKLPAEDNDIDPEEL